MLVFWLIFTYEQLFICFITIERMNDMSNKKKNKKTNVLKKALASGVVLAGAKKLFDNKEKILSSLQQFEKKDEERNKE